MEAEVEKRLLVRFAPLTALRERRVTPREVSIVLVGDNNKRQREQLRRKGVGYGKELGKVPVLGSDPEPTPTTLGATRKSWECCWKSCFNGLVSIYLTMNHRGIWLCYMHARRNELKNLLPC